MSLNLAKLPVPSWVVQLTLGLMIAITGFLVSNAVTGLQSHDMALEARVIAMESRNASLASELQATHIQLDTINTRGTSGADTRISALESRIASLETRVNTNSDRLSRLEQAVFTRQPVMERSTPNT